jgi:hypothetical protein
LKDKDSDLAKIGMRKIGNILGNAPKDPTDNIWPTKYVRDILEKLYYNKLVNNDDLVDGIFNSRFNSIGFKSIDRTNPGKDWIEWAAELRNNANSFCFKYPITASILEKLAKTYDYQAKDEKRKWYS